MRVREDTNQPSHYRPQSPNVQLQNSQPTGSLSPNMSPAKAILQPPPLQLPLTNLRPSSPNVDRRQNVPPLPTPIPSTSHNISQFVIGNLQIIQQRIVAIILSLISSETNNAGNDDRLVVRIMA
jgi:hypothetical protein